MNVGALKTVIRNDYLDDPSGSLWDDATILRYLNESERQACNRTNFLFDDTTYSITLVDGTASYALSELITQIEYVGFESKEVKHISKHEIQRKDPEWRTKTIMTDKVVNYLMRGRTMTFTPKPATVDDAKTVSLEVFRLPKTALALDADIPEIPDEFHRDLIYWVLHEAYKKQDADTFNQERADYYLARFTEVFGEYVSTEVRLNKLEQARSLKLRPTAYDVNLTRFDDSDEWD